MSSNDGTRSTDAFGSLLAHHFFPVPLKLVDVPRRNISRQDAPWLTKRTTTAKSLGLVSPTPWRMMLKIASRSSPTGTVVSTSTSNG
jgi:hypothetical protein